MSVEVCTPGDLIRRLETTIFDEVHDDNVSGYGTRIRGQKRKRTSEDDGDSDGYLPHPAEIETQAVLEPINAVYGEQVAASVKALCEDLSKKSMLGTCAQHVASQPRQNDTRRQLVDSKMQREEKLLGSIERQREIFPREIQHMTRKLQDMTLQLLSINQQHQAQYLMDDEWKILKRSLPSKGGLFTQMSEDVKALVEGERREWQNRA